MKAIFEIEFETDRELTNQIKALAGIPSVGCVCGNRLMLLKDIRDLARKTLAEHREPTLEELRVTIWKHVTPV